MFEKVNPKHPDKIADRIAGAIVDLAYWKNSKINFDDFIKQQPNQDDIFVNAKEYLKKSILDETNNPKVAVEVLIGHGVCHIIAESSVEFDEDEIRIIVNRIGGYLEIDFKQVPQDEHLANNQAEEIRCGDNGIFKGVLTSPFETKLTAIAQRLYKKYNADGKYIIDKRNRLIICQSNAEEQDIRKELKDHELRAVNPLGYWTGGTDVDTGATNRKLGSDMGRAVTGGGLHGKDLSKADVSINIVCYLEAQKNECSVTSICAIGDKTVTLVYSSKGLRLKHKTLTYQEIVNTARKYVADIGGFESLAEWGIIR